MTVLFSICSNNYLAQALTLFQSSQKYSSNFEFVLFIVDKVHKEVDYQSFGFNKIVFLQDLLPEQYQILVSKYNIIELNTSIKASCFKYLISNYKNANYLIYFDPDTKIFSSLEYIEKQLKFANIVLTPHILSPIPLDGRTPQEHIFLNCGIYNLGFLGISTRSSEIYRFLNWWEERLFTQCYINHNDGLFVDQIWFNLVPLLFSNVDILQNPGCNMAPWNLHERSLSQKNGKYHVNGSHELIFYHFSSIDDSDFSKISKPFYNRYDLINRADLQSIYSDYFTDLKKNSYFNYKNIIFDYCKKEEKKLTITAKKSIISDMLKFMKRNFRNQSY